MRLHAPPCPRGCERGKMTPQLVGFAVKRDHIVDIYICHYCRESFKVRTDDPDDHRFTGLRAECAE